MSYRLTYTKQFPIEKRAGLAVRFIERDAIWSPAQVKSRHTERKASGEKPSAPGRSSRGQAWGQGRLRSERLQRLLHSLMGVWVAFKNIASDLRVKAVQR